MKRLCNLPNATQTRGLGREPGEVDMKLGNRA